MSKIINWDSLKVIEKIEDNSIDLIVTDPPYWDWVWYGRNKKVILNNEDESINYKIIPKLYDKLKDNSVMYLFTNWKFENKLRDFINTETNFNIRMLLIVVKNNIWMWYWFRNQYECCIVCEKWDDIEYKHNDFSNVIKMGHIEHNDNTHPHQKGKEMLKKMITHSSNEGDLVLDPFAWSWSVGVACKEVNREYTLIELDEEYYNMCKKRLNNSQSPLFNT